MSSIKPTNIANAAKTCVTAAECGQDCPGWDDESRCFSHAVYEPSPEQLAVHIALMEAVCEAVIRWRHANEIGLGVRGASEMLIAADTALAAYRNGAAL